MYSVLLIDDEPLILSGIKFLLDWPANNCEIIDTARNGKVALEKIRTLQPDIVLCDINMPIMSGIELLKIAAEEYPHITFIMLTNLQDFDLAQIALRHKAVDYVLKNQLEAEALEHSLSLAKKECDNRNNLAKASHQITHDSLIESELFKTAFLQANKTLHHSKLPTAVQGELASSYYGCAYISIDYSSLPTETQKSEKELQELFAWQKDIISSLAQTHFPKFVLFEPESALESIVMFCWQLQSMGTWEEKLEKFYSKLSNACANITRANPCLFATKPYISTENLSICRNEIFSLRDYYYNFASSPIYASKCASVTYQPLGLVGVCAKLKQEIANKSVVGCDAVFARVVERFSQIHHERSHGLWLCSELYSCAAQELNLLVPSHLRLAYFENAENAHLQINRLQTCAETISWLEQLREFVVSSVSQFSTSHFDFLEKAKLYVGENIETKITLTDVADYVNISPAYLSSLYKKTYGENFVDYINSQKMARACEMLKETDCKIYEISYKLGFENAYYFTRVFKRFIGMKPTEFQRKTRNDKT